GPSKEASRYSAVEPHGVRLYPRKPQPCSKSPRYPLDPPPNSTSCPSRPIAGSGGSIVQEARLVGFVSGRSAGRRRLQIDCRQQLSMQRRRLNRVKEINSAPGCALLTPSRKLSIIPIIDNCSQ
ncbi:MAG: hypothetical protein BJ554DRAFT_5513, partial [Olpidium bornovanus]